MTKYEIKQSKILDDLTSIDVGGEYFDLHNNYKCVYLKHFIEENKLIMSFKTATARPQKINKVEVVFEEVEITRVSFTPGNFKELMTIDNFYRGRYEVNNALMEYSPEGKAYYYFEFYDGYSFEVFAMHLILQF
jgi:hypothetical protein